MSSLESFIPLPRIAYFSMEIALRSDIPTYAGGLGVLAGDTLRAAADLEVPLVAITLVSRQGYFRQELDTEGNQSEHSDPWTPEQWLVPLDAKVAVPIENRSVWIQGWLYIVKGGTGYEVPVILLDTDLPENAPKDRTITDHLYGGDEEYRLKQEIVLGVGGARMLQAVGFEVHTYHMNEGHSALLALELLRRCERDAHELAPGGSIYDVGRVRALCMFTTHTPVEAGHDQFAYPLVSRLLGDFVDIKEIKTLGGTERLNMTRLALNLSSYVNGVAKSHALTSNHMFPGYRVHSVTNGVHPTTWASPSFARLYDAHIPDWRHEPEILVRADQIPNQEIWDAHLRAKQALIDRVRLLTGTGLDPARPIIGFARRMTSYKRPLLLFRNLDRLRAIAAKHPLQIVLAGKAHPHDEAGKNAIRTLHRELRALDTDRISAVYLPNYDMEMALHLVSGADLWLNTPLKPLEASGTSGMKAALNGVLNLGVLDGWWLEGHIEGVTGWAVGSSAAGATDEADAESLYNKLEQVVLPCFDDPESCWIPMMKQAIAKNGYYFNSHRMMRRYATEAYIR